MSSSLTGSSTGSQVLAGELGREGSAQSVMAPISYSGAPSASSVASLRIDPASGQLSMSNSMRMMRRSETKAGSIDDGMLHVGKGGGGGGSSLGHSHGASSRSSVFSQESSLPSIMSKITHKIEDWLAEAPPMPDVQSDLDELVERLVISKESKTRTFCLDQREIMSVCSMAKKALLADPSLLALAAPVKIVGNLNGHYNDLLGIITACGVPANTSYLFLGGYVSHGVRSLETICLLLCYKVKYPNTFFLLRGSEETPGATKTGGFLDECKKRASMTVWRELISVFDCMPLAAVIKKKVRGLSPSLNRIEDISNIQRPYMFEHTGIVADLLFSQPDEVDNAELAWTDSKTGIGYEFNTRVLHSFLNYNSFDLMVRSKQLVQHGFEFWGKQRLVSIFSASQFCGRHDNDGAVLEVDAHLKCSFTVIESVERKQ
ncbi:serine/threonine protein phosphatase Pzh1 [Polyrhizophydium stewartii]|uniref:protein-serine/threonine phosphatase n=1 Tax=Polyrhizophydium stewartii TaxID=2732419 RepID=A0ABR4NGN6_9FUNG